VISERKSAFNKVVDFEVWFGVDRRTSECGYVAAASLLEHREKHSFTNIQVAYVKGEESPADWWESRLKKLGYECQVKQVPIDIAEFMQCKPLFDSHAAFLRLLIPFYSRTKQMVYTDVDVIFQEDIAHLVSETHLRDSCLALVKAGVCASRPEREHRLLADYGKDGEQDYFFSGLAVIARDRYIQLEALQNCKVLVDQHAGRLDFHDQTIWNCAINNIEKIHSRWCHPAYPGNTATASFELGIVHFVGSPKPWDLLGELYHPHSQIWLKAASRAGLKVPAIRKYFHLESWRRAYRIRRQYRCWFPSK